MKGYMLKRGVSMYKKLMFSAIILIGEMEGRSNVAVKRIKITQVYNHVSDLQDRLVLYFSSAPDCLYIPQRGVVENNNQPIVNADGMKELTYFFPVHGMSEKEINRIIAKTKKIKHEDYSVEMHHDRHKDGMIVKICFNDKKIGFQYESFTAITGEPALSFAFFKRGVMQSLNIANKNLFNTAYCKKKIQ